MSKTISRTTHDAATASAFMMNPQDRMNYVNRQMAIMDYNSGMNAAEERGEKRGEERMQKLNQILLDKNRIEDLRRASTDEGYCAPLMRVGILRP